MFKYIFYFTTCFYIIKKHTRWQWDLRTNKSTKCKYFNETTHLYVKKIWGLWKHIDVWKTWQNPAFISATCWNFTIMWIVNYLNIIYLLFCQNIFLCKQPLKKIYVWTKLHCCLPCVWNLIYFCRWCYILFHS